MLKLPMSTMMVKAIMSEKSNVATIGCDAARNEATEIILQMGQAQSKAMQFEYCCHLVHRRDDGRWYARKVVATLLDEMACIYSVYSKAMD